MTETPRQQPISLSVIMPAKDEEEGLDQAVRRMLTALDTCADTYEIIVINDGSTDRTREIAERLALDNPRVRALHNARSLNYGRALLQGIQAARCEWILHDPVDLPLAPEDLQRFTGYFSEADIIVVRRTDHSANSPWRKLTSKGNARLLRLLFGSHLTDLNFVQFYRRASMQSCSPYSSAPASVAPELILRAERNGHAIKEVEAVFRARTTGRAHFGRPKDILWTLRDMIRLRVLTWLHGWSR